MDVKLTSLIDTIRRNIQVNWALPCLPILIPPIYRLGWIDLTLSTYNILPSYPLRTIPL
jgi:hypothetical protein